MLYYRFYSFDGNNKLISFADGHYPDEAAAVADAQRQFPPGLYTIEVWQSAKLIYRGGNRASSCDCDPTESPSKDTRSH